MKQYYVYYIDNIIGIVLLKFRDFSEVRCNILTIYYFLALLSSTSIFRRVMLQGGVF
jgi:hypothetical protein